MEDKSTSTGDINAWRMGLCRVNGFWFGPRGPRGRNKKANRQTENLRQPILEGKTNQAHVRAPRGRNKKANRQTENSRQPILEGKANQVHRSEWAKWVFV